MSKKLYRVAVEHVLYVMADSPRDAADIARRDHREEEPVEISPCLVSRGHKVEREWSHGSLPWGGDDERTVVDIIREMGDV